MECPHCHARWKSEQENRHLHCPVCAAPLSDQKEPFHLVWAGMEEDALKKRADGRQFDAAASHFLQAVREDPYAFVRLLEFMNRWPALAEKSTLLRQAADYEKGDSTGLKPDADLCHLLTVSQAQSGNPAALVRIAADEHPEYRKEVLKKTDTEPADPLGKAALSVCLGAYEKAMEQLKASLQFDPDKPLQICDLRMARMYTGLDEEASARIVSLHQAAEQENLARFAQLLIRPLLTDHALDFMEEGSSQSSETQQKDDGSFDHLALLDDQLADWTESRWPALEQQFAQDIEQKICLRGMHLALNALKSRIPALESAVDALLEKHFVQVYMQPYQTVAASDFCW